MKKIMSGTKKNDFLPRNINNKRNRKIQDLRGVLIREKSHYAFFMRH